MPSEDADHDDHLAGEDDAPAELGRRPAAEDRADGDAGPGDAAEHPVGEGPVLALEVGRDEGDHRRQHERGADPLEDRPAEHQAGNAPGGRREGRAGAVDAEADREGAPAPEEVAELAAGQHQARHHQGVEGDHDLDRRHGGVEVVDQLGDRDVHHRLVEDHQELRGPENAEDSPLRHARTLCDRLRRPRPPGAPSRSPPAARRGRFRSGRRSAGENSAIASSKASPEPR